MTLHFFSFFLFFWQLTTGSCVTLNFILFFLSFFFFSADCRFLRDPSRPASHDVGGRRSARGGVGYPAPVRRGPDAGAGLPSDAAIGPPAQRAGQSETRHWSRDCGNRHHAVWAGPQSVSRRVWCWSGAGDAVAHVSKLQALVYDILPSTIAVFSYAIGSTKLSANEQFFCWCSNSSKVVTNNSNNTRHVIYSRQQSLHQHK